MFRLFALQIAFLCDIVASYCNAAVSYCNAARYAILKPQWHVLCATIIVNIFKDYGSKKQKQKVRRTRHQG